MNKDNEKIELTDNDLKQITGGVGADTAVFKNSNSRVTGTSTILVGGKTARGTQLSGGGSTQSKPMSHGTLC